jgi:hypothetical protein
MAGSLKPQRPLCPVAMIPRQPMGKAIFFAAWNKWPFGDLSVLAWIWGTGTDQFASFSHLI